MATIKELFTEHGVENTELQAKIEGLLTTAESKKADGIPYSRFKEKVDQAQELKADNAELQSKYEKLEKTSLKQKEEVKRLGGIEADYDTFKANELKTITGNFDKVITSLTVEETDPKYETYQKVLKKLTKATDEVPLTAEQIKSNLTIYEYAKEFGGLDIKDEDYDDGKNQQGNKTDDKKTAFETFLSE